MPSDDQQGTSQQVSANQGSIQQSTEQQSSSDQAGWGIEIPTPGRDHLIQKGGFGPTETKVIVPTETRVIERGE